MGSKIIEKTSILSFPLKWANLEYLPESEADKKEIYVINKSNVIDELIFLFYTLFRDYKDSLYIYNASWWDFCLDIWNPNKDEYDYTIGGKSEETKNYLKMLQNSEIENGYSGSCKCLDWDIFLLIILKCIISHQAPYSPILYHKENDFLFYFHHSGSIGIYYRSINKHIMKILQKANEDYDVR